MARDVLGIVVSNKHGRCRLAKPAEGEHWRSVRTPSSSGRWTPLLKVRKRRAGTAPGAYAPVYVLTRPPARRGEPAWRPPATLRLRPPWSLVPQTNPSSPKAPSHPRCPTEHQGKAR